MKKLFLSVIGIAALLLFFPGDGLAADHVKAEPVKADPAKVAPVKAAPDDDLENALKAQVDALRKIKGEYQHTRNVQHFRDTEDDYLWGASLYRLGRWREALAMFYNVQDQVAEYKLTERYIKLIEQQIAQEKEKQKEVDQRQLLLKCKIIKEVRSFRVLNDVVKRYAGLYQQGLQTRDDPQLTGFDKNIESSYKGLLEEKQNKEMSIKNMYLEWYVFQNLGRFMKKADKFDQEVFTQVRLRGYEAASKKINEFQNAMLADLKSFKESLERRKENFIRSKGLGGVAQ